jgi:ferrous iron transport protein B
MAALCPGIREVGLGTVYALSAGGGDTSGALMPMIASSWSLATALSMPVWYVFAPQCLSYPQQPSARPTPGTIR